MATKKPKNGIDTEKLFQQMLNSGDRSLTDAPEEQVVPPTRTQSIIETQAAEKAVKKTPVQIYLTPDTALQLRLQGAAKTKEKDKTAIAMAAIEILLEISDETYLAAKNRALLDGVSVGEVFEEALKKYLI